MIDGFKTSGCSKDTFNKWLARGKLMTDYPPSRQGVAREFTRKNIIELTFVTAFTKAGAGLDVAVAYAQSVLRNEKLGPKMNWYIFPAGDVSRGMGQSELDIDSAMEKLDSEPLVIIPVRKILDRIDAALKAAAEEERD